VLTLGSRRLQRHVVWADCNQGQAAREVPVRVLVLLLISCEKETHAHTDERETEREQGLKTVVTNVGDVNRRRSRGLG